MTGFEIFAIFIILIVLIVVWQIVFGSTEKRKPSQPNQNRSLPPLKPSSNNPIGSKIQPTVIPVKSIDKYWRGFEDKIIIRGIEINSPLVYYMNTKDQQINIQEKEPSLIVIRQSGEFIQNYSDPYRYYRKESFDALETEEKITYLKFLSNGKKDFTIDHRFVALYIVGLERRMFLYHKNTTKKDEEEISKLYSEVLRICASSQIYPYIRSAVENFLDFSYAIFPFLKPREYDLYNSVFYDIPLFFRVKLGRLAIKGEPLQAEDAYKWLIFQKFELLTTPPTRCNKEHFQLFSLKFSKSYPQGIILKLPKTKIKFRYFSVIRDHLSIEFENKEGLPDFQRITSYQSKFQKLFEECTLEITPYSRYLGRNGENHDSLLGIALLPKEIIKNAEDKRLKSILEFLIGNLGDEEFCKVKGDDFFGNIAFYFYPTEIKYNKQQSLVIIAFLEKLGIGIEPDVRTLGYTFKQDHDIIIFKVEEPLGQELSENFIHAAIFMIFSVALSLADGNFSLPEKEKISVDIQSKFNLKASERKRLHALQLWAEEFNSFGNEMRKFISGLTPEKKLVILNSLLPLANADGYVSPEEIKFIKTLYSWLNLDQNLIYSEIHRAQTTDENFATIIKQTGIGTGYKIPPLPKVTEGIKLDDDYLRKVSEETKQVRVFLKEIFESTEEESGDDSNLSSVKFLGLDKSHCSLLIEMLNSEVLDYKVVEGMCQKYSLFADGALENIAEQLFRFCGQDVLILDDMLEFEKTIFLGSCQDYKIANPTDHEVMGFLSKINKK